MTGTGSLFSLSAAPYPAAGLAVFSFIILFFYFRGSRSTTIPHLNPRKAFELTDTPAKAHFVANARPMLETWFRENPGTAARVIGDAGEVTVLPASLVNEMRNDPRLSFSRWINIVCAVPWVPSQYCPISSGLPVLMIRCAQRISMLISPASRVSGKAAEIRISFRMLSRKISPSI